MKEIVTTAVIIYLFIMNIVGFASMAIDKKKAKAQTWRTPEKTLLVIAAIGGSFGSYMGMNVFRHKTKHLKFVICVPLFLILHIVLLAFLLWKFIL